MPGYEVKFTKSLDKSFECPICLTALREPVQVTPCGHRICKSCLQPILRNKKPKCPLDNLLLHPKKIFPDNGCRRQVLALEVYCTHEKRGCEWTSSLYELEKHLEHCRFADIQCPKNCGTTVERRLMSDHFNECLYRLTPCLHCSHDVIHADMSLHLQSCASFPISCPVNCGAKNLNKETLAVHVNVHCPLLIVPCKFVDAGCNYKAERQLMSDHLKENVETHLELLCELVSDQKKQIDCQKEKVQLQKEHIQIQREALASQRQEIQEIRSHSANGKLIWKIVNFNRKLMDAKSGRMAEPIISEPFYTHPHGYKICAGIWLNGIGTGRGHYISVGLQVQVGEYDPVLKWPVYPRYVFTLLDQCDSSSVRKDIVATFDPQCIERPKADRQLGKGARRFVKQEDIIGSTYCKEDTIFVKFSVILKQES